LTTDVINPDHYKLSDGSEVINLIDLLVEGLPPQEAYRLGSIIKYLARYRKKGDPVENLEKAKNFLQFLIDLVKATKAVDESLKGVAKHWSDDYDPFKTSPMMPPGIEMFVTNTPRPGETAEQTAARDRTRRYPPPPLFKQG
jgi:hypothetical protein